MTQQNGNGTPIVKPNYVQTGKPTPVVSGVLMPRHRKGGIQWGELGPEEIGRMVAWVCDSGAGLILGRTQDGGALSITILMGDKKIREYPNSTDDWDDFIVWCESAFNDVGGKKATA